MIRQMSAVHSSFSSITVQFKELGQQAWKKWACLPSPQPGVTNLSCRWENQGCFTKQTSRQGWVLPTRMGLASASLLLPLFTSTPSSNTQTSCRVHKGNPAKSPTCSISRTIDITWVITGSTPGNSFSYFPRCWVFGLWDHFDIVEELKARERTGVGPWSPPFQEMPVFVFNFHLSMTSTSRVIWSKNRGHRPSHPMTPEHYQICL